MIARHGDASYTLAFFQYYEGISFVNDLLNGNPVSGYRVFHREVNRVVKLGQLSSGS